MTTQKSKTAILTGKYQGKKLSVPSTLRAATSRVRKALIDILKTRIKGASVLDLYAGAGTVGLELLSNGANSVTFVEENPRHGTVIKKNYRKIEEGNCNVHLLPVESFLKNTSELFDIIFAGPPYKLVPQIPLRAMYNHLAPEGILIVEWYKGAPPPELKARQKTYRYGDTNLTFYYA